MLCHVVLSHTTSVWYLLYDVTSNFGKKLSLSVSIMNLNTENLFYSACLFCISTHLLQFHAFYKYIVSDAEMSDEHCFLIVICNVQINCVFA
jgi:hypothetical protein